MRRTRYQQGTLTRVSRKRGPDMWVLRIQENGKYRAFTLGTVKQIPTEAAAQRAAAPIRMRINGSHAEPTALFGTLVERYKLEELPERKSTRTWYKPWLNNYIAPAWGNVPVSRIISRPIQVEQWLKDLALAPKSKAHIKSLMHIIFDCAMRWGVIECAKNPMDLVRVRGASKRQKRRRIVQPVDFVRLLPLLAQPYRTMVTLAYATGLRVSELAALQWGDFDFKNLTLHVQRGFVLGTVDAVKTLNSDAWLPVAPALAELLLKYKAEFTPDAGPEDWLFPSPVTGGPYSTTHIQSDHIEPAGRLAGLGPGIGWHNFRHSYSTLLRANGEDIKVQQTLLRHADVTTTLNIYTEAVPENLRAAHNRAAAQILGSQPWVQAEGTA
jgi:integrase